MSHLYVCHFSSGHIKVGRWLGLPDGAGNGSE